MSSVNPASTGGGIPRETDQDAAKQYVKYHRLLAIAEREGRIDGKYRCPVCGMRFMTFDEADACCKLGDAL